MPRAHPCGNYDVEAAAERLGGREAEDPLRAGIPEPDDPFGVGDDDGVGQVAEQDIAESIEVHASVSPPASAPTPWRSRYSFRATALLCRVSQADRKRSAEGKSVSVRVALGYRRLFTQQ